MRSAKKVFVLASVFCSLTAFAGEHGSVHHVWSYEGKTGPEHWGNIKKEFVACTQGATQSPVDLTRSDLPEGKRDIQFFYRASRMTLVNNGHTIQVNYDKGSSIRIDGKQYDLLQFHFHTPSEHAVLGRVSPMEVHLVHKAQDGELAVIGVMMNEGREHALIKTLWKDIPKKEGDPVTHKNTWINAFNLLPAAREHYHYKGSLTTPPCTEGVNWNVMTTAIEVSKTQINAFRELFPMNARPIQPRKDVETARTPADESSSSAHQ